MDIPILTHTDTLISISTEGPHEIQHPWFLPQIYICCIDVDNVQCQAVMLDEDPMVRWTWTQDSASDNLSKHHSYIMTA
jgi:hypothetical protein